MTLFYSFMHACKTAFSGAHTVSADALMGVALTDQTALQMARSGQTGASILHSKLCGLY